MDVKKWLRLAGASLVVSFCAKGFAFADKAIYKAGIKAKPYFFIRGGYGSAKTKWMGEVYSMKQPWNASIEIGFSWEERFCLGVEAGYLHVRTKEIEAKENFNIVGVNSEIEGKGRATGWVGFGAINATYCQPIGENFFGYIGVGIGGGKVSSKLNARFLNANGFIIPGGSMDVYYKCSDFSIFEQAFVGLGCRLAENCCLRIGYRCRYFNEDFTYKMKSLRVNNIDIYYNNAPDVDVEIKPIHSAEIGVHFVF